MILIVLIWMIKSILLINYVCAENATSFKCEKSPCVHGICVVDTKDPMVFHCKCENGYTGAHCHLNYNECSLKKCQNNATCTNLIGDFRCNCQPGYTGEFCESLIDNCSPNPCKNNGVCVNKQNDYQCFCKYGFTGHNCELNVKQCSMANCSNNGTCVESDKFGYTCNCPPGFTGRHCESTLDPCLQSKCQNNGRCVVSSPTTYECVCPCNFTGQYCELKTNACTKSNGLDCVHGVCRLISHAHNASENVWEPKCYCNPGYTGKLCDKHYPSCLKHNNLCENGGTCQETKLGYKCKCLPSFAGTHCEKNCSLNQCVAPDSAVEPKPVSKDTYDSIQLESSTHLNTKSISIEDLTTPVLEHTLHLSLVHSKTISHPQLLPSSLTFYENTDRNTDSLSLLIDTTALPVSSKIIAPEIKPTSHLIISTKPIDTIIPASDMPKIKPHLNSTSLPSNVIIPTPSVYPNFSISTVSMFPNSNTNKDAKPTSSPNTNSFTSDDDSEMFDGHNKEMDNSNVVFSARFNPDSESKLVFFRHHYDSPHYFRLKFDFSSNRKDGVLLQVSDQTRSDVLAVVYLEAGHIKYVFSCNKDQVVLIISNTYLTLNLPQQLELSFKLDLKKNFCIASISLNGSNSINASQIIQIPSPEQLCLKQFQFGRLIDTNNSLIGNLIAFNGCIQNIELNGQPRYAHTANETQSISECNAMNICSNRPCRNNGMCHIKRPKTNRTLDSNLYTNVDTKLSSNISWRCDCTSGYLGPFCELSSCNPNPCEKQSQCRLISSHKYTCLCDKWMYGTNCQFDNEPSFLEIFFNILLTGSELNNQPSVLMFMGQTYNQAKLESDYLLLTINNETITLSINLGKKPKTMSIRFNQDELLHEIRFGHSNQYMWLSVDDYDHNEDSLVGDDETLDVPNQLFVAGHRHGDAIGHLQFFSGCVFNVSIRNGSGDYKLKPLNKIIYSHNVSRCPDIRCHR